MNKIEIAVIAAWVGLAGLLASTASYGKDFSVAGQTVSIGASSDLNYKTGV